MNELTDQLVQKAGAVGMPAGQRAAKPSSISDLIKVMEPEIRKALPGVITPERFTRIALSAVKNTPKLAECTPLSFLSALMNAAQLGLEPNTPLGQAYLIPYQNHNRLECQFQIGYKGMIDLAYRNERMQSIEAHTVYRNDEFYYEFGLNPTLKHIPTWEDRGEIVGFYAVFRLDNGGCHFEVMSKSDVDAYAAMYSRAYTSDYSPWKTNYEQMALKTVLKRLLKTAPVKSDFRKAISMDETIKEDLSVDMSEVQNVETEYCNADTEAA